MGHGERIAQLIVAPVLRVEFREVASLSSIAGRGRVWPHRKDACRAYAPPSEPALLVVSLFIAGLCTGLPSLPADADADREGNEPPLPVVTRHGSCRCHRSARCGPFTPGEELTYAVKFGPIRAGTAVLTVVGYEWANGGLCYRLRNFRAHGGLLFEFLQSG